MRCVGGLINTIAAELNHLGASSGGSFDRILVCEYSQSRELVAKKATFHGEIAPTSQGRETAHALNRAPHYGMLVQEIEQRTNDLRV